MANLLEILMLNAAACTALACLVWTAGLLPAVRRRPALRYGLWMIVLVKLVTPPLIELRLMPYWQSLTTIEREPVSNVPLDVEVAPMSASVPIETSINLPAMPLETVVVTEPAFDWRPWLLAAHIGGIALILSLSLRQVRRLRRALHHSDCGDKRVLRIVHSAAETMGMTRPPKVSLVNASVPPLLWVGRNGPLIVLPRGLVDEMSDEQLTCVVSHEMAHYLRRDHWGNAASWLVSAAFWWHPVVWWVRRELRTTQEACCDALVISRSVASRQSYAKTLFQALEFLQSHHAPVPALASGFGGKSSTQRRFEMIANPKVNHRLSWWNYLLLLAALAALPFWPAISSAEEIALGDCPAAVQTTLQALQGAGQILIIERDADGEDQFYQAEVAINGKVYDVRVSDQGTLLSTVYSRVAEQSGELVLHAQSIDVDGGTIELVFSSEDVAAGTNSDSGLQGVVVIEEEHLDGVDSAEGRLEIQIAADDARLAEIALRDQLRARLDQDQAAHVEQLQAEVARLTEMLKKLEADAAQHQRDGLRQVVQELQAQQERLAEEQQMQAAEQVARARAHLDAQVHELRARERQEEMQLEIVREQQMLQERVVREQLRDEAHAQRQRLIGGLPEAIRNTLERETNGGSITRISAAADEAGAVTYTAQVQYQTDAGPRAYEIAISEGGELIHKRLMQVSETRTIEIGPDGTGRQQYRYHIEEGENGNQSIDAEGRLQLDGFSIRPSEELHGELIELDSFGLESVEGENAAVGAGLQIVIPGVILDATDAQIYQSAGQEPVLGEAVEAESIIDVFPADEAAPAVEVESGVIEVQILEELDAVIQEADAADSAETLAAEPEMP